MKCKFRSWNQYLDSDNFLILLYIQMHNAHYNRQ